MALTPLNRQEEWYQEMIDAIGEGGGGGLPEVTSEDKGKYLHVNDSTGDLEWSDAGGSGGGPLVVTDTDSTLDKTWQEILDAMLSGGAVIQLSETDVQTVLRVYLGKGTYAVISASGDRYLAPSASGYPTLQAH